MENQKKLSWEKIVSRTEAKKKIVVKSYIVEVKDSGGGGQASYNIPADFFSYLKEKNYLKELKREDTKRGKIVIYSLKEMFKVLLDKSLLKYIKTNSENPKFIFVKGLDGEEGAHTKPQINTKKYKTYFNETNDENYKWFPELYDNNIEGNTMIYEFSEIDKTLRISIEEVDLSEFKKNAEKKVETIKEDNFNEVNTSIPHQRIYFGAPGTGKSYLLNEEAKNLVDKYERVTFHPNYMYGNFIGTFKPFPKKIDGKEEITYKYVPGVLLRLVMEAFKNPKEDYMLVIEEINRANTAGVFGDFFQLLDRNEEGESQYPISTSEELREYLREEFKNNESIKSKLGEDFEKIYLPKNLYIWATMNSSDQGIMPLDTAFKRRWNFKYIGIDEGEEEIKAKYYFKDRGRRYLWNEFRKKLNEELLKNCNVPEDKLLGPYFIDKATLDSSSEEELMEVIKDKVLMYLYEDIGKMYRNILFSNEVKSYSSLCIIFSENINKAFKGIEFKDNLTYIVPKEENFEEEKLIAEDSINN